MGNEKTVVAADVRQVVENGIDNTNNKEGNNMNNANDNKCKAVFRVMFARSLAGAESAFAKKTLKSIEENLLRVYRENINISNAEFGMVAECLHLRDMIDNKKITCENDLKKEMDNLTSAYWQVRQICSEYAAEVERHVLADDDHAKHKMVWHGGIDENTILSGRQIACQWVYNDVCDVA